MADIMSIFEAEQGLNGYSANVQDQVFCPDLLDNSPDFLISEDIHRINQQHTLTTFVHNELDVAFSQDDSNRSMYLM